MPVPVRSTERWDCSNPSVVHPLDLPAVGGQSQQHGDPALGDDLHPRTGRTPFADHHRSSSSHGPAQASTRWCLSGLPPAEPGGRAGQQTTTGEQNRLSGSVEDREDLRSPRPGQAAGSRRGPGDQRHPGGRRRRQRPRPRVARAGWTDLLVPPGHQGDAVHRAPATGQYRREHRFRPEQALHPGKCPTGPLVVLPVRPPEPVLDMPGTDRLDGLQNEQGDGSRTLNLLLRLNVISGQRCGPR